MYQSNEQMHKAFIAALHLLEKIPIQWKLKELRLQNIFNGSFVGINSKKCTCINDYDKILTFPYFFPIFPSEGQLNHGIYSVLPFFYLIAMNDSKAFPIVELLEIPLIYKELYLSKLEKEKIDSILLGTGVSHIASKKIITKENLSDEIPKIRKSVISKIFGLTSIDATIIFSVFSRLPKAISLFDNTGYIDASAFAQKNILWPSQSNRIIPIKYKKNVFTFTLSSWALGKNEV